VYLHFIDRLPVSVVSMRTPFAPHPMTVRFSPKVVHRYKFPSSFPDLHLPDYEGFLVPDCDLSSKTLQLPAPRRPGSPPPPPNHGHTLSVPLISSPMDPLFYPLVLQPPVLHPDFPLFSSHLPVISSDLPHRASNTQGSLSSPHNPFSDEEHRVFLQRASLLAVYSRACLFSYNIPKDVFLLNVCFDDANNTPPKFPFPDYLFPSSITRYGQSVPIPLSRNCDNAPSPIRDFSRLSRTFLF